MVMERGGAKVRGLVDNGVVLPSILMARKKKNWNVSVAWEITGKMNAPSPSVSFVGKRGTGPPFVPQGPEARLVAQVHPPKEPPGVDQCVTIVGKKSKNHLIAPMGGVHPNLHQLPNREAGVPG